ncbi:site-specific DNA-methyltransferase (adenine-specific) [Angulomicrobium tetraedrale]|uniref:Methyltransferase n=1 Tax=Ancylobacter tetraedralis TaxID=217068 RepID=A0A839Z9Z4_9HYPH|nr:DNA methyltransferase [Ancylobacter tetraedralis]MBB3771545.1 site-specific DNA-methyltransferase (adenine-specific) [Ancylobacter tetraedralis]
MSPPESFLDGRVTLHCGDSRDVLDTLEPESIDHCVCDPPYALVSIGKRFGKDGAAPAKGNDAYARASAGFMGQGWDTGEVAFSAEFWRKVWRVLKPGGHVVAFGGTRAYHRLASAIEDAGFEIRDSIANAISLDPAVRAFVESLDAAQLDAFLRLADQIEFEGLLAWVYGTGFPKSHDVSKALDKMAGAERPVIGRSARHVSGKPNQRTEGLVGSSAFAESIGMGAFATAPVTDAAREWQGWGTALKPAWEPIVLARKPLVGSVAENVLAHGTGALNIDGCRVATAESITATRNVALGSSGNGVYGGANVAGVYRQKAGGRHPANIIHDGSAEVVAAFPVAPGALRPVTGDEPSSPFANVYGDMPARAGRAEPRGDSGSAARFFYSAKADADDRLGSTHPTVKPVDLMAWLVRLVTVPGGVVLDPFAGTGTTGEAAWREGCRAVLIEREPKFQDDIRRRMALCGAGAGTRKRESAKARAEAEGKAPDFGPLFAGGEAAE